MEYNLTCRKAIPGALTTNVKYNVSYYDSIAFKVKTDNGTWIMTKDDIIEFFRIML